MSAWKLVPVEPTPRMLSEGSFSSRMYGGPAGIYRAMLEAAPSPPPAEGIVGEDLHSSCCIEDGIEPCGPFTELQLELEAAEAKEAKLREALEYSAVQMEAWLRGRAEGAVPGWMRPTLAKVRAALADSKEG